MMGRHIRWQAILSFTGIAMTMAFLGFLSLSRTTVTVPDEAGSYTEGIAGVPQFINPLLAQYNQVDQDLTALIFNGLTRFDMQGHPVPDLAESWQVSSDGLVYVFKLRQSVRWQDGEPFNAEDVLFTIGLMQAPDFPGAPYLQNLWSAVTAEQLDPYTVRFTLLEPFPAFADFTTLGILPEHKLRDIQARDLLTHPFNLAPVGTGPYQLDTVNADFARLSLSPFYTGPRPRLASLELRFYNSYQETIAAYRAGQVQGISYIPSQALDTVDDLDSLNLYTARRASYDVIYLNLQAAETLPFFQEVEVRQALLYALDRQALINEAMDGQGLPATGPIHPWSWAFNASQPTITHNFEQAVRLLDEAGWQDRNGDGIRERDGQQLAFTLLTNDAPNRMRVAEAVSSQWERLGVAVAVDVAGAGLAEQLAQRSFQAALATVLTTGDPDPYPFWHQAQIEGGQNYAGWDDDDVSILLETARAITDEGQRTEYYFEFQRLFAQEVPALILFYPVYTYGVNQDIYNVQLGPITTPSDRFRTLPAWYTLTQKVVYRNGP